MTNLLSLGDPACYSLNGDWILDSKPVALTLQPSTINKDTGVGCKAGKGEGNMVVELSNLRHRSCVLELQSRLSLDAKNHDFFSTDANLYKLSGRSPEKSCLYRSCALVDSLKSILNLEKMTVRGKNGDSTIVTSHAVENDHRADG